MHLLSHLATCHAASALVLAFAAALSALGAPPACLVQNSPAPHPAPPAYPDSVHVTNGCHLSTIAFLARFLAEFPSERGEPLVVKTLNADGIRRFHTIALISWHGQSWCRDEYLGTFALDLPVAAPPDKKRLVATAVRVLEARAQTLIRAMLYNPGPAVSTVGSEERIRDVMTAVRIIPFPTTIFWVKCGVREFPVAFFRPTNQQIAVYHPVHGTCLAKCSSGNDAKVVALVAAQFGYHVDGIRAEPTSPRETEVASVRPTHALAFQPASSR
jgi:hypothetical protein